jgi:diphthamide biosynthesis protein 3
MSYYDEIEIEDMTFDSTLQIYHFPCPCGDRFEISLGDMRDGEDVGVCPSCSLMIRVIFEAVSFPFCRFGFPRCVLRVIEGTDWKYNRMTFPRKKRKTSLLQFPLLHKVQP